MRVPAWLTLGVALLVLVFGVHRIRLSFRSDDEEQRARQRRGLYAMSRRAHRLIGIVYVLLGGALVAATYGWSPFGRLLGVPTAAPRDRPPTSTTIPIDQLPPPPAKK
jgi:hypothetical protein